MDSFADGRVLITPVEIVPVCEAESLPDEMLQRIDEFDKLASSYIPKHSSVHELADEVMKIKAAGRRGKTKG